ncbi:MAG: hypothetical protein IPK39_23020 [Sulfuritalea sp.]|nr:hypothetical protein [Sulfuritalea sp.]
MLQLALEDVGGAGSVQLRQQLGVGDEELALLEQFDRARNATFLQRVIGIWKSGVYLQTTIGNLGLIAATLLKKLLAPVGLP